MAKDSPLAQWLKKVGMSQAELAALAEVDYTVVSRTSCGAKRVTGKLRVFLQDYAPEVLAAQDEHIQDHLDSLRKRLKEAA